MGNPELNRFAKMLQRHREGILNRCDYPIGASLLEGINNKIKVIKRTAYGFHDDTCFSLKVMQAADPSRRNKFGDDSFLAS